MKYISISADILILSLYSQCQNDADRFHGVDMVLGGSWALRTPGMNMEEEIIIRSPIYTSSSEMAILSVIQPNAHSSNEIFYDAFSLEVRK